MAGRTARRIAILSLAWLCGIAIASIVGEVATRLTGAIDVVSIFPRRLLTGTDDPLLPYRLRPGATLMSQGVPVRVNRFGLRGAEIAREPGNDARRILVLGDSAAYGWGLAEADTFPVLLGEELRRLGMDVEVLNAAVPGYNTESAVALLRHTGLSLAPDALVLGVSLNDFEATPSLSPLGLLLAGEASADDSWLAAHSEFYFLFRWVAPALLKQWWRSPDRLRGRVGARRASPGVSSAAGASPAAGDSMRLPPGRAGSAFAARLETCATSPQAPGWSWRSSSFRRRISCGRRNPSWSPSCAGRHSARSWS